jgi:hypothetical protein
MTSFTKTRVERVLLLNSTRMPVDERVIKIHRVEKGMKNYFSYTKKNSQLMRPRWKEPSF